MPPPRAAAFRLLDGAFRATLLWGGVGRCVGALGLEFCACSVIVELPPIVIEDAIHVRGGLVAHEHAL
eukprot:391909-Prymnesium_polylepis.1